MTERGLPIVDGAPACPFVAFDEDRDERAASPDHRHRCYAESVPAPRALAHQEAYCLSSAFPVCPTFQDWARREAARSRTEPPRAQDPVASLAAAPPNQRNPPRNWAAPPPWVSRGEAAGQEQLWDGEDASDDLLIGGGGAGRGREPGDGIPEGGRGLSGSYADRVASQPVAGMGASPGAGRPVADEDAPGAAGGGAAALSAGAAAAAAGAAGTAATHSPMYPPVVPSDLPGTPGAPGAYDEPDDWDEPADEPAEPQARRRRERDPGRLAALGGRGSEATARSGSGGGGGRERPRRDPRAPEWERARPMEAYPTLRSRRLSELSIPPILVGVVALALAAAVLFALPGLLGFGNPSAGGSPSPTLPTVTPIVTPAPTPVPEPTDQIYIVQPGDTMSRIAGKFGLTLEELIAANAETIPDPNKLQIGDQVIIPARDPEDLPAASEIPAAS